MPQIYRDEYHWDPELTEDRIPAETLRAPEYPALACEEILAPAPEWQAPPEFESERIDVGRGQDKRRETVKKLFAIPVVSTVAVASIVFAAFGQDFLKNDALAGVTSLLGGLTPATTESSQPATPSAYTDAFPKLSNLQPDFAGQYAWSGAGSEEYVMISVNGTDSAFLHAGSYYTSGGYGISSVAGASYDKSTNTLTLTDFHGSYVDANLMGNGFTVKLVGDNSLDFMRVWGAMYGGSVTFTGSGSLTLNESGSVGTGLLLNGEYSASCLMIDREVTLDVCGQPALMIGDTLIEEAICVLAPIQITGGEITAEQDGTDPDGKPCYTVSVTGADGQPASRVTFKPAP